MVRVAPFFLTHGVEKPRVLSISINMAFFSAIPSGRAKSPKEKVGWLIEVQQCFQYNLGYIAFPPEKKQKPWG